MRQIVFSFVLLVIISILATTAMAADLDLDRIEPVTAKLVVEHAEKVAAAKVAKAEEASHFWLVLFGGQIQIDDMNDNAAPTQVTKTDK